MISVIIPTLNAEDFLNGCLESVWHNDPNADVIVVDGGSQDQTCAVACANNVNVISSQRGRGRQLNVGAQCAQEDIFLFLHADTVLPDNAFGLIKETFRNSDIQVATFRMQFDYAHGLLDFYSSMTGVDSVWTSFGDQGVVVRRSFFEQLGGFPNWSLFEDVCFFQEARRKTTIYSLPAHVTTSAQKFLKNGILKQQLKNGWLMLQYVCGVSPEILARKYAT